MTDIQKRPAILVPLTTEQVADMEAHYMTLGLPSLTSLAEGTDDEETSYPYETSLDKYLDDTLGAAMFQHEEILVDEDPEDLW